MSDLYGDLDTRAAAVAAQVVRWRQYLHEHPELSDRETENAALITTHPKSLGLDDIRTDVAGHGVVGMLRGGLPGDRVVALRADVDALPVPDLCGVPLASHVVDQTLVTGVRLHAQVGYDHLSGALAPG
ncbi:hypothetical protein ACFV4K_06670 [Nocardia sp. NPDC059764]|uniref:hypothetical protein n=1 Tax=Nocardia sp. NPDC059764 TaxID=3346939 RepID=UPI003646E64D